MGNENSKEALAAGQAMGDDIQDYVQKNAPEYLELYHETLAAKMKRLEAENATSVTLMGIERLDSGNDPPRELSQVSELEEGQILSQESELVLFRSKTPSQPTDAEKLLFEWQPRKEKIPMKRKTIDSEPKESSSDPAKPPSKRPAVSTAFADDRRTSHAKKSVDAEPKEASSGLAEGPLKHPSVSTAFTDDRRTSLPKIPKKATTASSPLSPPSASAQGAGYGQELQSVGNERPPKWYKDTPLPKSRQKNISGADTLLQSLKEQITKCKKSGIDASRAKQIRDKLHKIFFIEVNASILKANRMLHDEDGLPQLFDKRFSGQVVWPYDIRADANELYNKWCRRVFETDLLRGIAFGTKQADGKTVDSIEESYKPFVVSSKFHGNGDLLNGQWWPLQLCALRDGAHGATIAGISGDSEKGAYSCIMSGGHDYPDKDDGDVVLYCGTDSDNGSVTGNTKMMLESVNNRRPVRLIRSSNLKSDFAPEKGFRYDGLYDVVSYEMLDATNSMRQRHRFRLVRQPGQDPVRGGKGEDKRPTEQERDQYENHRRMSGKTKGRKPGT